MVGQDTSKIDKKPHNPKYQPTHPHYQYFPHCNKPSLPPSLKHLQNIRINIAIADDVDDMGQPHRRSKYHLQFFYAKQI
jgi:hypothetical protein